jgi:hypothetical protein
LKNESWRYFGMDKSREKVVIRKLEQRATTKKTYYVYA